MIHNTFNVQSSQRVKNNNKAICFSIQGVSFFYVCLYKNGGKTCMIRENKYFQQVGDKNYSFEEGSLKIYTLITVILYK